MTTQSSSIQRRRGASANVNRKYTAAEWIKGYAAWLLVLPIYLFLWAFARTFKRVPAWLLKRLIADHKATVQSRKHDVRIPFDPTVAPYMLRWWKIKRNAFFNIYYHRVLRSDDDRALHDHPWWNFSIILAGSYFEHCINDGGVNVKTRYDAGAVRFRRAGTFAHRLELERYDKSVFTVGEKPVHTIFITGPVLRRWGFHHPEQWVDAYDFDDFCNERNIGGSKMAGYDEQLKGPTT